jgi:hypothetical protein
LLFPVEPGTTVTFRLEELLDAANVVQILRALGVSIIDTLIIFAEKGVFKNQSQLTIFKMSL